MTSASSRCWISIDALRRQVVALAVEVRVEGDAVLGHLPQVGQRHDLEPAGIGQDRAVPVHEAVQPAELGDPLGAGPQHQVIGVAEHDLGAGGRAPIPAVMRLDRAGGADRHEGRRFHRAVGGGQRAAPGRAVGCMHIETQATTSPSWRSPDQ